VNSSTDYADYTENEVSTGAVATGSHVFETSERICRGHPVATAPYDSVNLRNLWILNFPRFYTRRNVLEVARESARQELVVPSKNGAASRGS